MGTPWVPCELVKTLWELRWNLKSPMRTRGNLCELVGTQGTYGNFLGTVWELRGNLKGPMGTMWELVGSHRNLWELHGSHVNLWEHCGNFDETWRVPWDI